ncbi:MAG: lipopolysaccharide heptosyltransferase II [Candidatus Omnitrophota bacterium]|nr:lipopolysaccharide heptosyltransferase II [Candidatus Omnitrophota bacterium]
MERILVVLPNWFGETLFATPVLRALRQHRPRAFLATLGRPQCREVLLHNPHVDDYLVYDEQGLHQSLAGKWRLTRTVRARAFTTAFILRKSLSRSLLLFLAGIPIRVGFDNPKSGWLLTHRVPARVQPTHKASAYFPLVEVVGVPPPEGGYDYRVSDEERRAAQAFLSARQLLNGRALVVLHPGANWPHKRWPTERFAALGDQLVEAQRAQIALTGGADDVELAGAVARRMRHPATVLAGQTTLRECAACVEQAQVVVSNDTGLLHVAAALGRPLVALYGPTSPRLTGPLGDPRRTVVLHHPDCCPSVPCYQPERPPHPGMSAISVDEAYEAASDLLKEGERLKVKG